LAGLPGDPGALTQRKWKFSKNFGALQIEPFVPTAV
jgi:hypothetical protein